MANYSPDTYVLYQPVHPNQSSQPGWPGVVCRNDNRVPAEIRAKRHFTHNILILLIGKSEYRWANPCDLKEFDFICVEAAKVRPGLKQAYEMVTQAIAADLPPHYWSMQVNDDFGNVDNLGPNNKSEEESDYNSDIGRAIEESLKVSSGKRRTSPVQSGFQRSTPSKKFRPNPPAPPSFLPSINGYLLHVNASPSDKQPSLPIRTMKESSGQACNRPKLSFGHRPTLDSTEGEASNKQVNKVEDLSPESTTSLNHIGSGSSAQSETPSSWHPISNNQDKIEGVDPDLLDDADWVTFLVGPERKKYIIPLEAVQSRPCFYGANSKLNVVKKGNGQYFERKSILRMDPKDFDNVAEYLQTGEFGRKVVENENDRRELIKECLGTWEVARELGILDLLEHIEQKLSKSLPWPLGEAISVARFAYKSDDSVDPTEDSLKRLTVAFIAEHFWGCIDENHQTELQSRFNEFPQLEVDVLTARAETLKKQHGLVGPEEEEEEEEEEDLTPDYP